MSQTITLDVPETFYEPLQRMAKATQISIEAILLTALQAALPSLEGLSPELAQELSQLELLDNGSLRHMMLATVPMEQQTELTDLLAQNKARQLTEAEQTRLMLLQQAADKIMLQKARAAVLLRFRGQRLPTLKELRQLTVATS